METNQAQRTCSIQEFVTKLNGLPESAFSDVHGVLQLMQSFLIDPGTLGPYLLWDTQHYTRNLIQKTDLYALMAICWEPGQSSSIHNHQGQNCWMAVPSGRLLVENYRVLFQNIDDGRCKLKSAETFGINAMQPTAVDPHNPVHRVHNPKHFDQRAISLHVYSRPFDECAVYSQDQGVWGLINLQYTTEYRRSVQNIVAEGAD
jgi:cysteine dioxygenase